jgi:hypothetical protein
MPVPQSWDARAGKSCGFLQLPCYAVRGRTMTEQASLWLSWLQQGGLAALSGYGKAGKRIAAARAQEAADAVRAVGVAEAQR